jgi:DivIVA domain-containing protein
MEDVDQLVDRIEATLARRPLAGGPVTAEDVRKAKFRTVRMKPGYDEEEVDAALDDFQEQLRQLDQ